MIPASKTILTTLTGASITCALLLIAIYSSQTPLVHTAPSVSAAAATLGLNIDDIIGKAAIVYDPVTKEILFAKNADERLPLASLTKLMSAEAVLAHADINQTITITAESLKPDGDWGFKVGEEWPLGDLITLAS
jgi:D-alanyl-D-alanine carboxypeptidase (penicillin-binding protein 5/6)